MTTCKGGRWGEVNIEAAEAAVEAAIETGNAVSEESPEKYKLKIS